MYQVPRVSVEPAAAVNEQVSPFAAFSDRQTVALAAVVAVGGWP